MKNTSTQINFWITAISALVCSIASIYVVALAGSIIRCGAIAAKPAAAGLIVAAVSFFLAARAARVYHKRHNKGLTAADRCMSYYAA